jgi:predicted polyphosphate/ATP-dependent NAD kinase
MTVVGIIANPASGKDIRRLVAHAATIDNRGKVSIVRCALVGLGEAGVDQVMLMPDTDHLGERAIEGLGHVRGFIPRVSLLDMPVFGQPRDSEMAAQMLCEAGAASIILLGGDGTVRVVSRAAGDVPLLPISTGTNNVLPGFVEGTIAGLAAGYVATGRVALQTAAQRHKWIEIMIDGLSRDRALVDVAVLGGRFVGARAVWDIADLHQVMVTRADPASIGISSLVGRIQAVAVASRQGAWLQLSHTADRRIRAILGPGLIAEAGVKDFRVLQIGESVDLPSERPLVLALDGERDIVLYEPSQGKLILRDDGPWIIDARRVMESVANGPL